MISKILGSISAKWILRILIIAAIGVVSNSLIDLGYDKAKLEYTELHNEELKLLREAQEIRVAEFVKDKREYTRKLGDYYQTQYDIRVKDLEHQSKLDDKSEQLNDEIDKHQNILQNDCDSDAGNIINSVFDKARDITRPHDYIY